MQTFSSADETVFLGLFGAAVVMWAPLRKAGMGGGGGGADDAIGIGGGGGAGTGASTEKRQECSGRSK